MLPDSKHEALNWNLEAFSLMQTFGRKVKTMKPQKKNVLGLLLLAAISASFVISVPGDTLTLTTTTAVANRLPDVPEMDGTVTEAGSNKKLSRVEIRFEGVRVTGWS